MKKLLTLLLSILVCLSLVGCNKKDNTTNETVIEPTINEVVEVPNNTTQEEVVIEEVTTTELKEEVKDNTTLSYWVNFLNKDGSVLQRTVYKYGETPSFNGSTPTYTDYAYYYSFKGWDKQTSPVKGTQTYTALYDIVGEVPSNKTSEPTPTVTPNYLTFTANSDGSTISLIKYGSQASINLQYSIDGGESWNNYTWKDYDDSEKLYPGKTITLSKAGDSIKFKGSNTSFSSSIFDYYCFAVSDSISASGDVTSLLNGEGGDEPLSEFCFYKLFYNCKLTKAPNLPSTTLASGCYCEMFEKCTSLTSAPDLPATTLAENCYAYMFYGCTSLVTSPTLPATTLVDNCYENMFYECENLAKVSLISATSLATFCCDCMFKNCKKLYITTANFIPNGTDVSKYGKIFTLPVIGDQYNNYVNGMFLDTNNSNISEIFPSTGETYYWYISD